MRDAFKLRLAHPDLYTRRNPYLVLSGDELAVEGALHEGREECLAQDRLPQFHQLKLGFQS